MLRRERGLQSYKPPQETTFDYEVFKGGLNRLLSPSKINKDELVKMDNMLLVEEGLPTKRWGSENFRATGKGAVTGLFGFYPVGADRQLLAMADGFLINATGPTGSLITGYSYASGKNANFVQVYNRVYIVNGTDPLTRYTGGTIQAFSPLGTPTGLTATKVGNGSGTYVLGYRISARNNIGETLASLEATVSNLPQSLNPTSSPNTAKVRLTWSGSSGANQYVIYGRSLGIHRYMATVPGTAFEWEDDGSLEPSDFFLPPTNNSTEGPIGKYIITTSDKLWISGDPNNPSRVYWSGGGDQIDNFGIHVGGGYVDVHKDDGDEISAIIDHPDGLIVFKERSIWKITLSSTQGITVPTVTLINRAIGAVSFRSVLWVENDIFFLSRRGVFVLGNEPNIMSPVLRTNELTAKIRPFIETLNQAQLHNATALYHDNKYVLFVPEGGLTYNNKAIVYDRERLAWVGPWNVEANDVIEFFDDDRKAKFLIADPRDGFITEMSPLYQTDKGKAFHTHLQTRKEDFKDWGRLKRLKWVDLRLRNTEGNINVNILVDGRTESTSVAKNIEITSISTGTGMGFDQFGDAQFGDSNGSGGGFEFGDLVRRVRVNDEVKAVQLEITSTLGAARYVLLATRGVATYKGRSSIPPEWRT